NSGAIATLGSVLTKTRNGVNAPAAACDQAMAAPSRTPASAAIKNAPRISTAVIQMCFGHGISPGPMACSTESGLGNRYSRTPSPETANCQQARTPTNVIVAGSNRYGAVPFMPPYCHETRSRQTGASLEPYQPT